ncbi:NAM2 (YLR382C) [Zygosaccharomyces parabailii]|uniref:leucine--tRNA ligase n=1 Tax=Zygosaccharomyces bailii (strain CLIB 213 / ATCC 58445 / CBS 680 / BCRC 21525 / NBRC 1098 / NCYC 1416 / NRRL Y-2227) TaxID=1333698 RepID=A0A8J2TA73_ZYGB2|nr:NAM2 (YLR382C) [Zygosaccharomyces parabailii]CDF91370.1 ZYBA0S11-01332g1_1 [Zygosaccharomyces bailii CLIB 213]CDH17201.1 probable Leucine--tRNA ligase, mitochondrial [Zygosaccharomyces bailii ISA1307]
MSIRILRLHIRCYSSCLPKLAATKNLNQLGEKWKSKTLQPTILSNRNKNDRGIYILSQFPYPSGTLHMGHVRVYVISDSLSRFYRQNGYNVIHPMGWDAFGLPAENAAIDRGIDPADWTRTNIFKMKAQMGNMLASFDWQRELATCDPEYYKFTQMIFLELFKHGMAYRKEAEINWDPVDKTVLANEQVDSNGRSWRSGAVVQKKQLSQWFLGITQFAHELNRDLKMLTKWPTKVKSMQRHWIGESHGTQISFAIDKTEHEHIDVFTTRCETIFSAQYLALAINHPLVKKYATSDPSLHDFINENKDLPKDSKRGHLLASVLAENPLTGLKIPVYAATYVLGEYGESAVMGVPAHDERDYEFWNQNCPGKPIVPCLEPTNGCPDSATLPYTARDTLMGSIAGVYKGLSSQEARQKISENLQALYVGGPKVQYRLRDWLISRQRYWGAPIPIIHCDDCGIVPVPERDLPVVLPTVKGLKSKGNPLSQIPEFVNVNCPSCGKPAKRETDTMDTFMDSSWYYFRYLDPKNRQFPFGFEAASKHLPVDLYIGGVEHAILHMLYSRFIAKFLGSIGMWEGSSNNFEPFKQLVTQGMVQGKTYIDPDNGGFLKPSDLEFLSNSELKQEKVVIKASGKEPRISFEKMSKSKHNGVDPNKIIGKYGPDAVRAHILFLAPISESLNWDESKIVGVERWLHKLLNLSSIVAAKDVHKVDLKTPPNLNDAEIKFHNEIQKLLKSITDSFSNSLSLNTVVSDYMKFTNALDEAVKTNVVRDSIALQNMQKLIKVIYPVVPSISEEAREILNQGQNWNWDSNSWPHNEPLIESNTMDFQIVVNGKARFIYSTRKDFLDAGTEKVIAELLTLPNGAKYLAKKDIRKIIMKKRVISFILADGEKKI